MVGWVSQYRQGARVRHIGYTTHTYPALIVFPPNRSFPTDLMSQSTPASSSSPNFQFVLNAALEAYEKTVKSKLLDHPLTTQPQSCDSPSSILSILTDLVQQLGQSRTSDERLRTWLDPTVNVLFAFSATLGEGVGLVILKNHYPTGIFALIVVFQVISPAKVIFAGIGVLLQASIYLDLTMRMVMTQESVRRPRTSMRAKTCSLIYSHG
jgi:hypothetical protein